MCSRVIDLSQTHRCASLSQIELVRDVEQEHLIDGDPIVDSIIVELILV